jgi:hypothetical protein
MAYVYRHIRLDTNKVFYVGIGNDLKYQRSKSKYNRNKHWHNVVNKTPIRIDILFDEINYEEAKNKEIEFISLYGRRDFGIGTLVNMTGGGGTGTAIVDTGITYSTGDYGGYGRGVTYQVVYNGNPNGAGSAGYFAQYMGIIIIYTGYNGSAVTTYIQYTQLAGGSNMGTLTLTPYFWNGSSEVSSVGAYTTGYQIRLKISGYNSSATGQDQSVYLTRLT